VPGQCLKCEAAARQNLKDFYGKEARQPELGKRVAHGAPVGPTSFEEVVRKLRLSPEDYESSRTLKEWVRKNKDQKYIRTISLSSGISK